MPMPTNPTAPQRVFGGIARPCVECERLTIMVETLDGKRWDFRCETHSRVKTEE